MITAIVGTIIWLLPFILYLLFFHDPPNLRIVWSFITIIFTWQDWSRESSSVS